MCRPCSRGSPHQTGSFAASTTSFETGTDCCVGSVFCSGPPSLNRDDPTQIAIQLSMIVEITSCAPTVALRLQAMLDDAEPPSVPATAAGRMWWSGSGLLSDEWTYIV